MVTGTQALDFVLFEYEANTGTLAELITEMVMAHHKASPDSDAVFEPRLLTTVRKCFFGSNRSSLNFRRTLLEEKRKPLLPLIEKRQLKRRKTTTESDLAEIDTEPAAAPTLDATFGRLSPLV